MFRENSMTREKGCYWIIRYHTWAIWPLLFQPLTITNYFCCSYISLAHIFQLVQYTVLYFVLYAIQPQCFCYYNQSILSDDWCNLTCVNIYFSSGQWSMFFFLRILQIQVYITVCYCTYCTKKFMYVLVMYEEKQI